MFAHRLHALNFGPVLVREMRAFLRTRAAFFLFFALLLLLGSILLLAWGEVAESAPMEQRALAGRFLFHLIAFFGMCGLGATAALTTATKLTSEREARTFELLRCTGLSIFSILAGKWLSSVLYLLLIVVLLAPVMTVTLQFGGVEPAEMLAVGGIIAVTVVTCGWIGLAFSAWVRRSWLATILVILFLSLHNGVIPAGMLIAEFQFNAPVKHLTFIAAPLFYQGSYVRQVLDSSMVSPVTFMNFFLFHLALTLIAILLAWRGLARREVARPLKNIKTITDAGELRRRRRHFPFYLVDPLRRADPIPDRRNPVLIKESRATAAGRLTVMIRMFYAALIYSLFGGYMVYAGAEAEQLAIASIALILVFLPVFSSTALSREMQEQTLELLLASPLPCRTIVLAQYRLALRLALVLAAGSLFLPAILYLVPATGLHAADLLPVIPIVVAWVAFYAAVALFAGAWFRGSLGAILAGYAAVWGCFLLLPSLADLLVEITAAWERRDEIQEFYLAPIARWITPLPFFGNKIELTLRTLLLLLPAAALLWATSRRLARRRI